MRRIIVCRICERSMPHAGRGLCGACKSRLRREDPETAERIRESARRWKAANRDYKRAYDREYHAAHRSICEDCGELTGSRDAQHCADCLRREAAERVEAICAMWSDGLTLGQIADALDSTPNSIGVTITHLRQRGYDLPYRRARRVLA